jgi:hypothetical protein
MSSGLRQSGLRISVTIGPRKNNNSRFHKVPLTASRPLVESLSVHVIRFSDSGMYCCLDHKFKYCFKLKMRFGHKFQAGEELSDFVR